LKSLISKYIAVEISGNKALYGQLIDVGNDLIVLHNGQDYYYIPTLHIQYCYEAPIPNDLINDPSTPVFQPEHEDLSLRKILTNAKGIFVEIKVTNNQTFHGYVTSILNNYFSFYTPVNKMMYISLQHLKWLIPYVNNQTPYSLSNKFLPVNPNSIPLARTLEVQLEKLNDELIIINNGERNEQIGKVKSIDSNFIELISAKGLVTSIGLRHVKTIHLP
jgi:hypothetical protein